MKMIKLSEDHYIVVDDSEIKEGDWIYNAEREPSILKCVGKGSLMGWQKITYSTQPLELICCTPVGQIKRYVDCNGCDRVTLGYNEVKPLSLSEVKELLGVVDKVEELSLKMGLELYVGGNYDFENGVRKGYYQALEDNKEKKYTETDIKNAIIRAYSMMGNTIDVGYFNEVIQSLQPKTEWEVEFVDGKLKLKQ